MDPKLYKPNYKSMQYVKKEPIDTEKLAECIAKYLNQGNNEKDNETMVSLLFKTLEERMNRQEKRQDELEKKNLELMNIIEEQNKQIKLIIESKENIKGWQIIKPSNHKIENQTNNDEEYARALFNADLVDNKITEEQIIKYNKTPITSKTELLMKRNIELCDMIRATMDYNKKHGL